jgi:outer membrane protein TolC
MKTRLGILGLICVLGLAARARGAEVWALDEAIRYALTNSPDARIAQRRIAAAQAGLTQARAAFSPQLQFQSSYLRTDNPMLAFGSFLNQRAVETGMDFNDVPDQDNLNVKGLLTMPLYAGGKNAAGRDIANAHVNATREAATATRNTLAFEVARAYHTVVKAREFIKATEAGVRAFETNVAFAARRLEVGTLLKSDVLDVEVRLAQAREDAVRARNAYALALRAFQNVLGLEGGEITVADAPPPEPVSVELNAQAQRPELAASAQRLQAAAAEVRRASSGYKPRLSAFGSLDYDYGTLTDDDGSSYTAGVLLQWDLWDGALARARRAEAQANFEAATEEDHKLRLALGLELEQARLALLEASERLSVTAKSVAQAGESVDMTRSRFEQGLALSIQLIDAETALTAARVRRAEAEADYRIAAAAVRKASGLSQLESSSKP